MRGKIKFIALILFATIVSSCTAIEDDDISLSNNMICENSRVVAENKKDETTIEYFLSQFVSLFFGPHSEEPAIKIHEPSDVRDDNGNWFWQSAYFTDGYGNVVYDTPYVFTANYGDFNFVVYAEHFHLFTLEGSSSPLIIVIRFESTEFSGGVYFLYEIVNNGNDILQLGSMIYFHWGGPGAEFIRLTPLVNETGKVIAYMFPHNLSFYAVNCEGDFELLTDWETFDQTIMHSPYAYTTRIWVNGEDGTRYLEYFSSEELAELLSTGQMQTIVPNFPNGNFVPMVRMYELEREISEVVTRRLRGTFPVVGGHLHE